MKPDLLVVGAGIIGSSVAWHLARLGAGEVLVVDRDLEGVQGSSERNAGGVRAMWWQRPNILLSRLSITFYETIRSEVLFRQLGYLWLYDARTWPGALSHLSLQQACGVVIQSLTPDELKAFAPFIDRLDGVIGATFSPGDGLLDPHLLKEYYRREARALGVRFRQMEVLEARLSAEGMLTVRCEAAGEEIEIRPRGLVWAPGPWAYTQCPHSYPLRRQVFLFGASLDLSGYGMVVDTSGVYFHAEGPYILGGFSNQDEPEGVRLHCDGEEFFTRHVWLPLSQRISVLEEARYVRGWAGLYDMSRDVSAIMGRVPGRGDVYECHSFSGRGVMQSYGAGLSLAELIVRGRCETLPEAAAFDRARFETGALLTEDLHI